MMKYDSWEERGSWGQAKSEGQGAAMSRILIVDDDVAVCAAIRRVLEQDGHAVVLANNGRAGVSAAESQPFDIVICDIFMPGMDGIETISSFHQIKPDLPVIAMSGFTFRDGQSPAPDYLSLSTKLGAARSLRKPFRPHELIQAVRECIAGTVNGAPLRQAG
jgi:CheY-like chemotaxis protein